MGRADRRHSIWLSSSALAVYAVLLFALYVAARVAFAHEFIDEEELQEAAERYSAAEGLNNVVEDIDEFA